MIDCTGHGVSGALMTMVASTGLRRITDVDGCLDPAEILKRLNSTVKKSLQQETEHSLSNDGLDAAFCLVNPQKRTLAFAGSRLPLLYIKDKEINRIKGDRHSLGYKESNLDFDFTEHKIEIEQDMSFYLHSDGIVDQLGGPKRISLGSKHFIDAIQANSVLPFIHQKDKLFQTFNEYIGENETKDDITVLGFSAER